MKKEKFFATKICKALNNLIKCSELHGGDAGGSYQSNYDDLLKSMKEVLTLNLPCFSYITVIDDKDLGTPYFGLKKNEKMTEQNVCKCWETIESEQRLSDFARGIRFARTGRIIDYVTYTKQICNGTREREECHCNGDERQCDFYPEKR